jgi:hypothetical protein
MARDPASAVLDLDLCRASFVLTVVLNRRRLGVNDRDSLFDPVLTVHPRGGTGRQQLVRRRKIGSMKTWPISSIKLSIKDSSGERWKRFQRHW